MATQPRSGCTSCSLVSAISSCKLAPHGFYRYNIEDIVEVNGFFNRTPMIHFVQKARMVTSITG